MSIAKDTSRTNSALLQALINPRSVALIGTSSNQERVTARPLGYLVRHGFAGNVYPVHPTCDHLHGRKALPKISEVPGPIDHAYILLEKGGVIEAFEQCVAAGVKVISVLSDGFAEMGAAGKAEQDRLRDMADDAGILLLGPNSMGIVNTRNGFVCTTNAAFGGDSITIGRCAVLSQSGSLIGALYSRGAAVGIGFSTMASVGNEAQTDIAKIGALLLDDPDTDAFVLLLETIRDVPLLKQFALLAHERGKPVAVYTLAKSKAGNDLSVSHTGALAGAPAAMNAFLAGCGFHQLDVFEAGVEAPFAILKTRESLRERPRSVTVISTTGGGGAMVVDQLSMGGTSISGCPEEVREKLETFGISGDDNALIDVTLAGARYDVMKTIVSLLITNPETGILIVVVGSSAQLEPARTINPVIDAIEEADESAAPVFAFALPDALGALQSFNMRGIPAFRTVESLSSTVRSIFQTRPPTMFRNPELPETINRSLDQAEQGLLNELQSYRIFEALGLQTCQRVEMSVNAELPADLPFGFPVSAKIVSSHLPHKTEAGAVRLSVPNRDALLTAIREMRHAVEAADDDAKIEGILIQPMCNGLAEVLVGMKRDPVVGPIVTLGMGGVLAEVYGDVSLRPAPVPSELALDMIDEVKGLAIIRGYRGAPMGDVEGLADVVVAVSSLALNPRVAEAEINPLLVHKNGQGTTMLDALIRLR